MKKNADTFTEYFRHAIWWIFKGCNLVPVAIFYSSWLYVIYSVNTNISLATKIYCVGYLIIYWSQIRFFLKGEKMESHMIN